MSRDSMCQELTPATFTNGHLFLTFLQVDLVAQGDSIYDIIDPADHLTVRQQLTLPSALDTGKNFSLPPTNVPPAALLLPSAISLSRAPSYQFSLHSPRSPLPLPLQYLQVPPAPECRQQTGAYSRPIPRPSTWGLLGRKPRIHSFLCPTGAKTPPWPWPWPCLTLPGHVPEPSR